MVRKKLTIGDIFEVYTSAGLAYIQYTHKAGSMGELVRVLPGLFNRRPRDFNGLAKQRELYFTFFTLKYAVHNQQVEFVCHQPVPDEWRESYPFMRWPGGRDPSGKVTGWKIFNAADSLTLQTHKRTPVIRSLTPEQERLSIHQLWPPPVLVKQLARGWTPDRADELRLQDAAEAEQSLANPSSSESQSELMKHYLYFPKKPRAEEAGKCLRDRGFSVEVRKSKSGEDWLVRGMKALPKTGEQMDELRDVMKGLAAQFGGEYDGWEAAADSFDSHNVERRRKIN